MKLKICLVLSLVVISLAYAGPPRSRAVPGIPRDSRGRIARSSSVRQDFLNQTGYPNGRPGYIVDHVVALKRGGPDAVSNLQWQTVAEAKAKDKVE